MRSRNLKSVHGMHKKTKSCGYVRRQKLVFVDSSILKPRDGMQPKLLGESYTYIVKNVERGSCRNLGVVRLILCVMRSPM